MELKFLILTSVLGTVFAEDYLQANSSLTTQNGTTTRSLAGSNPDAQQDVGLASSKFQTSTSDLSQVLPLFQVTSDKSFTDHHEENGTLVESSETEVNNSETETTTELETTTPVELRRSNSKDLNLTEYVLPYRENPRSTVNLENADDQSTAYAQATYSQAQPFPQALPQRSYQQEPSAEACLRYSQNPYSLTLLPLLGILLDFLRHTTELEKASMVVALMKSYLDVVPESQEKNVLLLKLKYVEDYTLHNGEAHEGDFAEFFNFPSGEETKTRVVIHTNLPALDKPLCKLAFTKLLQTSLNLYQDVAKQPECRPNAWQNLFTNTFAKPKEPIVFEVVYPNETPRPTFPIEFQPPNKEPNQPSNVVPQDVLEKIKLLLLQPSERPLNSFSPPNENRPLNPFAPSKDNTLLTTNSPYDQIIKLFFPEHKPLNNPKNKIYGPLYPNGNPGELLNPINDKPSNNLLEILNLPKNNPSGPTNPPLDTLLVNPPNNLENLLEIFPSKNVGHPQKPSSPSQVPTLTLDVLVKLLGIIEPEGGIKNTSINPSILPLLLKFLYPEDNKSVQNRKEIGDVPNNLDIIHLTPHKKNSLDEIPLDALPNDLLQLIGVSNSDKLPSLSNNGGFIELTYALKRPKPLIYQPVYYVKYRVPYKTFVQNFKVLVSKRPELLGHPSKLYQELLALSNVTQLSPNLTGYKKDEILKLIFGNGALVDAKIVKTPSADYLNEQLELIKSLNSNINPQQLGLDAFNLLNASNHEQAFLNKLLGNNLNLKQDLAFPQVVEKLSSSQDYKAILEALGKGVPLSGQFSTQVIPMDINLKSKDNFGRSGGYVQVVQGPQRVYYGSLGDGELKAKLVNGLTPVTLNAANMQNLDANKLTSDSSKLVFSAISPVQLNQLKYLLDNAKQTVRVSEKNVEEEKPVIV